MTKGSPFFQRAAMKMFRQVVVNFQKEQGPDGARWKPLKRPRPRGGTKILQDRGILRASVLFRGYKDNAQVRTNLRYAATHQHGDKRRNIPARPYMWMPDALRSELTAEYGRWVAEGRI